MNTEILDLIWEVAAVVFASGMVWAKLEAINKSLERLEEKVERHNTFDRRIVAIETRLNMTQEGK